MRSFSPSNGEATPSPAHHRRDHLSPTPLFQSTLSVQKLRRLNWLALTLRLAAFCFSLASAVFMVTNSRGSASPRWYDFDAYRYMVAANSIVTLYSLFELGVSVWEMARNTTLFPEILQVWFDFGHDQVFAYMQVSAGSAGTALAKTMKRNSTMCGVGDQTNSMTTTFCVQSEIAIGLGFVGFLFLTLSCLLSGFRLACFVIKGSRIHL